VQALKVQLAKILDHRQVLPGSLNPNRPQQIQKQLPGRPTAGRYQVKTAAYYLVDGFPAAEALRISSGVLR
jgi:hypothetical protein